MHEILWLASVHSALLHKMFIVKLPVYFCRVCLLKGSCKVNVISLGKKLSRFKSKFCHIL